MTAESRTAVPTEMEYLERARTGDRRAFEELYRANVARVYGLCLRLTRDPGTAEDCTQETFINAWRNLAHFEGRSAIGTWLHRIAVNAALGRSRRGSLEIVPQPAADEEDE